MSVATRAATVVAVVLAIGAAAKAAQGGKKGSDKAPKDEDKTFTQPATLGSNPGPGDGTMKPDPIRTGGAV